MSQASRQHLAEAGALHRLRQLREQRAMRAAQAAQRELQAAQGAVAECQARLPPMRDSRLDNLTQRVVPGVGSARAHAFVDARIVDLDDQIERAEDALLEAQERLQEALERAQQAHADWGRARARAECADTLSQDARLAHARAREHQDAGEAA